MTHHRCSPRARSHAQFRPIDAVNATWASRKPFRHQTCRLSLSSPPYKFSPRLGFQVSSFQVPQRELKEKRSEGCDSKRGEMGGPDLQMPPGFRFHPTDEELVTYYLCRKCAGQSIAVPIIAEIDLYKYEPWLLPGLALYGEKEWYFFSPRDRKYPNGSRPNRAAGSGYWKATGADKPITPVGTPKPVAIKKALVFYAGKAPKGEKTNWIMHEYRLADVDRSARRKNSLRLDDWVLCRIYNKKGGAEKPATPKTAASRSIRTPPPAAAPEQKPATSSHVPQQQAFSSHVPQMMDFHYFDTSDSMPRLHADSSCSGHVPSPEFAPEVQSRPRWGEWDRSLEAAAGGAAVGGGGGMMQFGGDEGMTSGFRDPLQDIFLHLLKPF